MPLHKAAVPSRVPYPPTLNRLKRMPIPSDSLSDDEHSKFELSCDALLETTAQREFGPNEKGLGGPVVGDILTLRANDRIGRYTIIKTLGSGGFGIVYLAQDPKLDRKVAIKMSRALDTFSDRLRTSLVDEARAAASLDHPNIIRVFDVDHWQNRTYVVMELVEGKSLADVISEQEVIPLPRVLGIMRQIALALEQLHAKGIIHRDLKPANILLTENEQVKVTDLGLALTDDSPQWNSKHIAGTQRYMSPEQVLGEVHRIDGRTDIWAFGVIVFEMLTLQSPFRSSDPNSISAKILKGEIASPRQRRPEIPHSLERLCLQCLSKRMTDRFQSAKQLSEAIAKVEVDSATREPSALVRTLPETNSELLAQATPVGIGSTRDSQSAKSEKKHSSFSELSELRGLVPRGLRAFSSEDSSYYYRLMPGPYDLEGRPAILNYWLKWVENRERNTTGSSVGVIYGASGSGKSSFVLASLIPSLSAAIKTVYFNFTVENPIANLIRLLHERFPHTKSLSELPQILASIRSRQEPFQVLLVFDQFEQYLINTQIDLDHLMVQAMRQCDGEGLRAMILVRDEFWSEISQFMQMLELSLADGVNASNHPLMNKVHARRVLESFGRAYEMLPSFDSELSAPQRTFIEMAIDGLAKDKTILCVRIAMFAELMKNYPWTPETIVEFGGVDGAVSRFLEDAFHSQNSPMSRRSVANICIDILRALLPEDDRELKSSAKSLSDLAKTVGEGAQSVRFTQAIRCLENDLRIISPISNDGVSQHFSLAHDYLVRPIQSWLTAQDNSTWQGRARQHLGMIANRYHRKPSRENLLGGWDWLLAAIATKRIARSEVQNRVMHLSGIRAMAWLSGSAAVIALLAVFAVSARYEAIRASENRRIAVNNDLYSFLNTKSEELLVPLRRLKANDEIAKTEIEGLNAIEDVDQQRRQVLLKALLGCTVGVDNIDQAVSHSDLGELEAWKEFLIDKSNQARVLHYLSERNPESICVEWQWLFLARHDYQLLEMMVDAVDPSVEFYKLLAFAAQDDAPFLDGAVRFETATELVKSAPTHKRAFDLMMTLGAHLIAMDDFKRDQVPKELLQYLERVQSDSDRNKALTAQWFLSIQQNHRVIVPPKTANDQWRIDEPVAGLPFKMIRIPEGAVTYEIAGAKGPKTFGIVMKEDIWMASEETNHGLVDAFFLEFPSLRDEDWKTDSSKDVGANNLVVPTILRFCNWLSDKAGLKRVYSFEAEVEGLRTVENFPEIVIDPFANGYRIPTFDELRFAGIHGDVDSFWGMIATKGMMERLATAPSSSRPTFSLYPNAWGFQGAIGNLMEVAIDHEWKIGLMTGHSQIQHWNSFTPFRGELSSKIEIAGLRIVQGEIESRPKVLEK